MEELVILELPVALLLYGIALFLCIFDWFYRATGGVLTLISTATAACATAYALIMGAELWECATVLLVFLLLNTGVRE